MAAEEAEVTEAQQMEHRLAKLYESGAVERLHTVRLIEKQTVASHTYGALCIAVELCRVNKIASNAVLLALLYHDAAEVVTGDIPAPVKRSAPGIEMVLERMEVDFNRANGIQLPKLSEIEQTIVRTADLLDLAFTCLRDRALGNRTYRLEEVFDNAIDYCSPNRWLLGVEELIAYLEEEWNQI